ncbi:MAG: hypothetical protein Q7T30_00035 [Planctomycetota bacterium]|nr:hypothetical protein [Planctomycetota bacterium]
MAAGAGPLVVRFPAVDLAEQVEAFAMRWPMAVADRRGWVFAAGDVGARLRVPLAALRVLPGERIGDYLARLRPASERQVVLLLQAGAMAIGCWDGDELVDHKAMRKYVVRGHGKAQPKHSRTRGKSRYGARLRLQNWQRLLAATNERLVDCQDRFGVPERIFLAVPVRVFVDLLAADPPPPFRRDDARLQRVPMHVHRPDHGELLRVRGWLMHGRLELPAS